MANPLVPISPDLNVFLRENPVVTLSNTLPAAPNGAANVHWQMDQFGNISAYLAGGGGSSLTLETNGTVNGSQTLLNLVAGSNVTLTDSGSGSVTMSAKGSAGVTNFLQMSDGSGGFLSSGIATIGNLGTELLITNDFRVNGTSQFFGNFFAQGMSVLAGLSANTLTLTAQATATSATAGAATALPATPAGYITISINGTNQKIPFYAV